MTPQMPLILSRLNLPADTPPSISIMAAIQAEYTLIYTTIKARLPVIGDPVALIGSDKVFFDAAAALLTAAKVYPQRYVDADGQILRLTDAEGATIQYAAPEPAVAEKWTDDARGLLQQIEAVKRMNVAQSTNYSLLVPCGRRRAIQAQTPQYAGYFGTCFGSILSDIGICGGYFWPV